MSPSVFSAISSIWSQNFNRMALSEDALREARIEPVSQLDLSEKNMDPTDMTSNSQPISQDRRTFFATTLIGLASGLPSFAVATDAARPVTSNSQNMKTKGLNPP